jgi:low affinity Fe/Cu permease
MLLPKERDMNEAFRRFSNKTSEIVGSSWSFIVAVLVILVWFFTGPMFEYSDTWQLIINTGTTIVTFLMVFLIQNTQNRDAKAIHLKLDELLRAVEGARTGMVDLENFTDKELQQLQEQFQRLRNSSATPRTIFSTKSKKNLKSVRKNEAKSCGL